MPKKSKTTTTEIITAIVVVMFVFSLIGIIGVRQLQSGSWVVTQGHATDEQTPPVPQGTQLGSGSQQVTVAEGVQVTQTQVGPAGTTLSSGSSDFQVMTPK